MNRYLIIIFSICLSASAQIILKYSSRFELRSINYFIFLFLAACFYFISFVGYSIALRHFDLSKLSPLMGVATIMVVVFAGIIMFKEKMSIVHLIGVAFGLISVLLLSVR